jgi:protein-tyrosine phosphatase
MYWEMLHRARGAVIEGIRALARREAYPAVFHCAAGKDRTGLFAALLLGLLGVEDHDIVSDYALIGPSLRPRLERMRVEQPERAERVCALPEVAIGAVPDVMMSFLDRLRTEYGTFDELASAFGVVPEQVALRALLLEPAGS